MQSSTIIFSLLVASSVLHHSSAVQFLQKAKPSHANHTIKMCSAATYKAMKPMTMMASKGSKEAMIKAMSPIRFLADVEGPGGKGKGSKKGEEDKIPSQEDLQKLLVAHHCAKAPADHQQGCEDLVSHVVATCYPKCAPEGMPGAKDCFEVCAEHETMDVMMHGLIEHLSEKECESMAAGDEQDGCKWAVNAVVHMCFPPCAPLEEEHGEKAAEECFEECAESAGHCFEGCAQQQEDAMLTSTPFDPDKCFGGCTQEVHHDQEHE